MEQLSKKALKALKKEENQAKKARDAKEAEALGISKRQLQQKRNSEKQNAKRTPEYIKRFNDKNNAINNKKRYKWGVIFQHIKEKGYPTILIPESIWNLDIDLIYKINASIDYQIYQINWVPLKHVTDDVNTDKSFYANFGLENIYTVINNNRLKYAFLPTHLTKETIKINGKNKLIDKFRNDSVTLSPDLPRLSDEAIASIRSNDMILYMAGLVTSFIPFKRILLGKDFKTQKDKWQVTPNILTLRKVEKYVEVNIFDLIEDKSLTEKDVTKWVNWILFNVLSDEDKEIELNRINYLYLPFTEDVNGKKVVRKRSRGKIKMYAAKHIYEKHGIKGFTTKEMKWVENIEEKLAKYDLTALNTLDFNDRVFSTFTSMKKTTERLDFVKKWDLVEIDANCCLLTLLWSKYANEKELTKVINNWNCFTNDPVKRKAIKGVGNCLFNSKTDITRIIEGKKLSYKNKIKTWDSIEGVTEEDFHWAVNSFIDILGLDFFVWVKSKTINESDKVYWMYVEPESEIINTVWEQVDGIRLHDALWVERGQEAKALELLNIEKEKLGFHNLCFKINS